MTASLRPLTDGVVLIRPQLPPDAALIVEGRDEEFHRFLGEGDPSPSPAACIVVDEQVVGWVDYDVDQAWLQPGEVNVGYSLFPSHRGRGYASRAVSLLLQHLAVETEYGTATLLIHPDNERSLALARRLGFTPCGDIEGNRYWKRAVDAAGAS